MKYRTLVGNIFAPRLRQGNSPHQAVLGENPVGKERGSEGVSDGGREEGVREGGSERGRE